MKAAVHYSPKRKFQIEIPPSHDTFVDTSLSYLWEETQNGIGEIIGRENQLERLNKGGARLRSSMVGDVFELNGDKFYIVADVGFVQISKEQFARYILVPERDRIMGWEWCRKYHNLGNPINVIK